MSVAIEEVRVAVTARTSTAASRAIDRATERQTGPATALDAVSLMTVLESSLRAELSMDPSYRNLGPRRFRDEVLALCSRVLGEAAEGQVA